MPDRTARRVRHGASLKAATPESINAKADMAKTFDGAGFQPVAARIRTSRAPTMQDIADALGVSQSTVSRVLTGAPTPVPINPVTRQRVVEMARQLRYRPNPLARGLRGSRTMLLGVIVREITDPFFAGAIDAISTEASKRGYNVVLGHAHGRTDEAIALRAVLETRHCDSIIIVGDTSDQPRLLTDLSDAHASVVGIWQGSASLTGMPTVNVDNRAGIVSVLDHLIGLGHRSFGFIGGSFSFAGGRAFGDIWERQVAFVEELEARNIDVRAECVRDVYNSYAGGVSGFEELMAVPNRPTAMIASTDVLAFGALRAASRLGLKVPDDVSIVGFDDLPLAEHMNPPLTTVRQPISDMAAAAVRMAIDRVTADGAELGEAAAECLQPTLVIRESSGPAQTAS